jgi:hypothetical protein
VPEKAIVDLTSYRLELETQEGCGELGLVLDASRRESYVGRGFDSLLRGGSHMQTDRDQCRNDLIEGPHFGNAAAERQRLRQLA